MKVTLKVAANAVEVIPGVDNICNGDFEAIVSMRGSSIQNLVSNVPKAVAEGHLSTFVRVLFSNLL